MCQVLVYTWIHLYTYVIILFLFLSKSEFFYLIIIDHECLLWYIKWIIIYFILVMPD